MVRGLGSISVQIQRPQGTRNTTFACLAGERIYTAAITQLSPLTDARTQLSGVNLETSALQKSSRLGPLKQQRLRSYCVLILRSMRMAIAGLPRARHVSQSMQSPLYSMFLLLVQRLWGNLANISGKGPSYLLMAGHLQDASARRESRDRKRVSVAWRTRRRCEKSSETEPAHAQTPGLAAERCCSRLTQGGAGALRGCLHSGSDSPCRAQHAHE